MAGEEKKSIIRDIPGVRKAAVLLISLGPDISSQVLKTLPEEQIRKVTYEIANIESVGAEERDQIMAEFAQMATAQKHVMDGGLDYAKDLLNKALGPKKASEVIDMLTQIQQRERPFAIARRADASQIAGLLKNEHPQTAALIMCYLQPDKAAAILGEFPLEQQTEIAERIGTITRTSPELVKKIEGILEDKFSGFVDRETESIGGVTSLVEILNSVDRGTEKNILSVLEERQPKLAQEVKANLFIFEDIIHLDPSSIQRILRDVENDDLVLALKGASDEVAEVIYENMSKRAGEMVKEDIQFMGPVRLSTVEEAQQKIVGIIRVLDDAGEIIMGRGDQDTIVV